ncbi:lysine-2,3-aminomutase-like protein [Rhodovarius crocodyli]|uniref:Lysine-2,3-aminomutase-like protein n=1 Tax=Rhodovarius crocodyli TaxID=1979269 RepID=A0A437LYX5_9PROT|nr:lysine-2,3-aminomutase-like protein [Rhodovarius crocodyli]RVT90621.1 lysine-2,3-aminomutase-like protein [Rhodovarius crocodyli]
MSRTLRTPEDLLAERLVPPDAMADLRALSGRYAISVTPAVQARIQAPQDPVARQYIPDGAELLTAPHELDDPTADAPFTPIKGVVRRYPDRALLKPLLACPVYCRFCFRREHVGPDGGLLSEAELEAALGWFAANTDIREAILTGGDPLMLSPRRLGHMLDRLEALPHIELLRIHSRVPVADPARINPAMLAVLRREKPLYLCVHANHAQEFGPEANGALRGLTEAGVTLLGQSVLLAGVNDSVEALEALFREMLRHRIKPYYLHALDPAQGTSHFAVPDDRALAMLRALRGRITGLAWPNFVRESTGGAGKKPLGPSWEPGSEDFR